MAESQIPGMPAGWNLCTHHFCVWHPEGHQHLRLEATGAPQHHRQDLLGNKKQCSLVQTWLDAVEWGTGAALLPSKQDIFTTPSHRSPSTITTLSDLEQNDWLVLTVWRQSFTGSRSFNLTEIFKWHCGSFSWKHKSEITFIPSTNIYWEHRKDRVMQCHTTRRGYEGPQCWAAAQHITH